MGTVLFSLYAAFEEQYNELFLTVNEIVERIGAKGALALCGLFNLSKMAGIDEISEDAGATDLVKHLVNVNGKLLADLKIARDNAADEGDSESEDWMIARIQVHEKSVWMLKSYPEYRGVQSEPLDDSH